MSSTTRIECTKCNTTAIENTPKIAFLKKVSLCARGSLFDLLCHVLDRIIKD